MKQALICASFGTTVANGRKDLEAVEQALQAVASDRPFCRAWTSRIIRKRMRHGGSRWMGFPKRWKSWRQPDTTGGGAAHALALRV